MATPSVSMPDAPPQDVVPDTATSGVADDPCGTGYVVLDLSRLCGCVVY